MIPARVEIFKRQSVYLMTFYCGRLYGTSPEEFATAADAVADAARQLREQGAPPETEVQWTVKENGPTPTAPLFIWANRSMLLKDLNGPPPPL